jgi:hypothetical protein
MLFKSSWKLVAFFSAFLLIVSACDRMMSTSIGKIIDNPRDYAGKQVTISGEVTEVFSFLIVKSFTLRDKTGAIAVVSNKPLPKKGTNITVRGTVQEAFSIGDRQMLVLMEDGEKQ